MKNSSPGDEYIYPGNVIKGIVSVFEFIQIQ